MTMSLGYSCLSLIMTSVILSGGRHYVIRVLLRVHTLVVRIRARTCLNIDIARWRSIRVGEPKTGINLAVITLVLLGKTISNSLDIFIPSNFVYLFYFFVISETCSKFNLE